jgi:hypothetical protein
MVLGDIVPGATAPEVTLEAGRFWIPALSASHRAYWHHQNFVCSNFYRRVGRERGLDAAARNSA